MVPFVEKINSAKVHAVDLHVLSLEESNGLWASINHIGHLDVWLGCHKTGGGGALDIFGELHQNGCQVFISGGLPGHSLLGCQKENGSDSHFAKCLDTSALWHMVAHGHFP